MFSGTNNVFFDPSSPITSYAESANGTENVQTESMAASLISSWTTNLATNLRVQFSRDLQQSTANSDQPWTKIYNVVAGFGGSSMLPRETREHKLHIADTLSYETRPHALEVRRRLHSGLDLQLLSLSVRRRILLRQREGESLDLRAR